MRIMVFDVPAEGGGALTILNQYYEQAICDAKNDWIFVVSTPKLSEVKNVTVLNFPWIKKSWFHRLYFDIFIAHKLVTTHKIDEVLSLQNIIIPLVDVRQTLYLHQSLPFAEKRYRITENFKFWIYQNIISKMIFTSIKRADRVIVQTNWIMDVAIGRTKVAREKFKIIRPKLNIDVKEYYKQENQNLKLFFYPAGGYEYKNHKVIVDAVSTINDSKSNFKVIFTLNGNENKEIAQLFDRSIKECLPIDFIGQIPIDEVYEYYSKSILLFASYIETLGLPMLEARLHKSPIIASDCPFSREVLDGYERAEFFNPFDHKELSIKIKGFLINE